MKRIGKTAGLLAAVALAAGLTVGAAEPAHADVTPPASTWVELHDPYTSAPACLDDPGGNSSPGTPLELWHCHGYDSQGTPQRWTFGLQGLINPGDGYQVRVGTNPVSCLSAALYDQTRAVLARCFIGPLWDVRSRNAYPGDPVFQLEQFHTGNCLALPDLTGGNAEPVILQPCAFNKLQSYWMFG
jgi:hypothetical protein